jgi:hypothetical protein
LVLVSICLATSCRKRSCVNSDPTAEITENHGHAVAISSDHVVAETPGNYGIGGSVKHEHMIRVNKSEMAELERDESVTIRSTLARAHSHDVALQCPK